MEDIPKTPIDYLGKLDEITSLKEGEIIELDYNLKHLASKNGEQARLFLTPFPGHLGKLEILLSYTNESRRKYYTRFVATKNMKTNEHLLCKPK